jgi:hypothetical protein
VSFASITLYVASEQAVPKVNAYFFIDSVRKLLDAPVHNGRLEPLLALSTVEFLILIYVVIESKNWNI